MSRPRDRRARRGGRSARGFSLIELMVALAVAAILLAVALPSLRGLLGEGRISAVTNNLVYALQLARSEAIKRGAPTRLCPSDAPLDSSPRCSETDFANGWIVLADADGNGVLDAGDSVVLQHAVDGAGVSFTPSVSIADGVRFDAAGASVLANGAPRVGEVRIELAGGDARVVGVRASGRIGSSVP